MPLIMFAQLRGKRTENKLIIVNKINARGGKPLPGGEKCGGKYFFAFGTYSRYASRSVAWRTEKRLREAG